MIYIYDKNGNLLFGGNADVKLKRRVMGEETLTVTIVSATAIDFGYGAYADALGERYYLHINPKVENNGKYNSYTLVLESAKYELGFAQMQSFGRADYDLTTDLEGWVKLIVANANRVGSGWSYVINDPDAAFKTLRVDGETCLASINRIYTDFGKEFRVVGKQIVVGRVGSDLSNVLKVGRYEGLYNVTEEQNGTSAPVTRLYVYGGERNIPANYRNPDGTTITPRLVLDAVNGGKRYIEQNVAQYGVIEDSVTFDDIYPRRTGVISSVNASDVQEFYDTSMDFDVNGQMLPGITPKVCFLTGDLAGYTFDLVSYDNAGKKFRLAVGNDGGGRELPNASLKQKAGDKYTLVDLEMPSSYVTAGENELLAKGQEAIAERSVFQSNFKANSIDPNYQQDVNFYPVPGDRIGILSNGVTKQVRIIEQTINLTTPVKIYESLEFADKVEPTALQQAANSAKATSDSIYIANKGAKDAQVTANSAGTSATAAAAAATEATQAANTAQESAAAANSSIADIASDDKITAGEKQSLKREWDVIVSEKDKNVQQADTFGVSRTAYVTAYSDLLTYLGTNLNDLTTTWNLGTGGGVTLRSKFKGYYDARTDLLNAISLKAKQAADAAQNAANSVQQGALMKNSATQQVVNSPVQFVGQVQINGDIIQNGQAYEMHAQHVFSSNDFMTLRDGAVANLADGSYTGFQSKRVFADGSDGYLVFGSDGMARVGKQASLQMLATREDTPLDGGVAVWSAANKRFNAVGGYYHSGNLNRSDTDFVAYNVNANSLTVHRDINGQSSDYNDKMRFRRTDVYGYIDIIKSVADAAAGYGGLIVTSNGIRANGADKIRFSVDDPSGSLIRLMGNGNCMFYGNAQSSNYSGSGFTATGWQIDAAGNVSLKSLTVREMARFYELEINKLRATNGALAVTDAAVIKSVSSNVITFDETPVFVVGDEARSQRWSGGVRAWIGKVTAVDTTAKTVTIGSFSVGDATQMVAGDTVIRWDSDIASRKGLLYLTASDAGSPNMQVIYGKDVKSQYGNIAGRVIDGETIASNRYGLWFKNSVHYEDGSGKEAGGNIAWDSTGATNIGRGAINISADGLDVTFSERVKMQWQSGGRNLLPNSKRKPAAQGAGSSTYNPDGTWTITDGTSWNVWEYVVPYQVGEAYTLSIKCKRLSGSGGIEVYFRAGDGYIHIPNSDTLASDWKVLSVTRIIQGNDPNANNNLHFSFPTGSIQVEYIQIEKGYNATDWTPALEDTETRLTNITSTGIYTGDLTANNINLGNGRCKITSDGYMTASDVSLTGKIIATSGQFGSLKLSASEMLNEYSNGIRRMVIDGEGGISYNDTLGTPRVLLKAGAIDNLATLVSPNSSTYSIPTYSLTPGGTTTSPANSVTVTASASTDSSNIVFATSATRVFSVKYIHASVNSLSIVPAPIDYTDASYSEVTMQLLENGTVIKSSTISNPSSATLSLTADTKTGVTYVVRIVASYSDSVTVASGGGVSRRYSIACSASVDNIVEVAPLTSSTMIGAQSFAVFESASLYSYFSKVAQAVTGAYSGSAIYAGAVRGSQVYLSPNGSYGIDISDTGVRIKYKGTWKTFNGSSFV